MTVPLSKGNVGDDLCPFMGFEEEQYIPEHGVWCQFYTCIANGRRVYVWAYKSSGRGNERACLMLSDNVSDPARKAEVAEIHNMFKEQHRRQKYWRTHYAPADPFLLQALIHHVTLAGNEHIQPTIGALDA